MILAAVVLAQFGLPEAALFVLSVIAGVGGAFVGWFVSDPVARITYRLVTGKPIPGWTLPWIKITCAVLLGLLVYFLVQLGGGPGGLGYGPGLGGGPGKGPGAGGKDTGAATTDSGTPADKKASQDKTKSGTKPPEAVVRKPVEIEVLGGKRYPGDERYYLLRATDKAMTIAEVEAYFKEHGSKLELHIVLTDESPDDSTGITDALTRLAGHYQILSLVDRPKKSP
jgi:hypothetical protein